MEGICAYCNQTFNYDEDKPGPKPHYCPGHRQAAYHHRKNKKTVQIVLHPPILSCPSTATDAIPASKLAAAPRTLYCKRHKLMHDSRGHYTCRVCGQSWTAPDVIQRECPRGPIYTEQNKPDYLVDSRFLKEHSLYPYGKAPDAFLDLENCSWYVCLYDKRKAIPMEDELSI